MRLLKSEAGTFLEVRDQDLPLDVPSARGRAQGRMRLPADDGGVHLRACVHPRRPARAKATMLLPVRCQGSWREPRPGRCGAVPRLQVEQLRQTIELTSALMESSPHRCGRL
eukprot:853956-Pyramimonas_sp.AAC.1